MKRSDNPPPPSCSSQVLQALRVLMDRYIFRAFAATVVSGSVLRFRHIIMSCLWSMEEHEKPVFVWNRWRNYRTWRYRLFCNCPTILIFFISKYSPGYCYNLLLLLYWFLLWGSPLFFGCESGARTGSGWVCIPVPPLRQWVAVSWSRC